MSGPNFTRCPHGFLAGYCVETSCANWDGHESEPKRRARRPASPAAKARAIPNGRIVAIVAAAADRFGFHVDHILGRRRTRSLADARACAQFACRLERFSYPEIGAAFRKDHTTVMHAVARVATDARLLAEAHAVRDAALGRVAA